MGNKPEEQAHSFSTSAKHKGRLVVVIRSGKKNSRICPMNEYQNRAGSEDRFSESCEIVPTSELTDITKVNKTKKKASRKKTTQKKAS